LFNSGANAIAFSPDGKLLESATNDKKVKLWEASSGAVLQTLKSSADLVRSDVNAVASRQTASC
jgi:WD40 repeat protein